MLSYCDCRLVSDKQIAFILILAYPILQCWCSCASRVCAECGGVFLRQVHLLKDLHKINEHVFLVATCERENWIVLGPYTLVLGSNQKRHRNMVKYVCGILN